MSEILEKYDLQFITVTIHGVKWKRCSAKAENFQKYIGGLLAAWQNAKDVQELIDEINQVINRQIIDTETGSEMIFIIVEQSNSEFYFVESSTPDLMIPTIDLRDILIEWKKYLELPD